MCMHAFPVVGFATEIWDVHMRRQVQQWNEFNFLVITVGTFQGDYIALHAFDLYFA